MRITHDVVENSPQFITPTKERALSLRGLKISTIENTGTTKDAFECLDFSDNEILSLGNFAPLLKLKTLILINNKINSVAEDLSESLPNLESLVLTGNKLSKVSDFLLLRNFKKLQRLSVLENPVTAVDNYRYFLIKILPTLRFLNFNKISAKERDAADNFFKSNQGKEFLTKNQISLPQ